MEVAAKEEQEATDEAMQGERHTSADKLLVDHSVPVGRRGDILFPCV